MHTYIHRCMLEILRFPRGYVTSNHTPLPGGIDCKRCRAGVGLVRVFHRQQALVGWYPQFQVSKCQLRAKHRQFESSDMKTKYKKWQEDRETTVSTTALHLPSPHRHQVNDNGSAWLLWRLPRRSQHHHATWSIPSYQSAQQCRASRFRSVHGQSVLRDAPYQGLQLGSLKRHESGK